MGGGGRGHMFFRRNRRGSVVAERMFGGGGRPYQTDCKLTANKGESQEYYRAFWGNQVNLIAIQPKLSDPLLLHPETIKYDRPLANLAHKTVSDVNMWLPYEDRVWKNLFLSNSLIIGIMHMVDRQGLTEAGAFRFFPLNPTPLYCGPSIQLSKTSFVWHK